MTISTIEDYANSFRRTVRIYSGQWPSNIAPPNWAASQYIQTDPGAMPTLAATSSGEVPEAGDTGFPSLGDSGGGQTYLTRVRANQLAAISGGSDFGRILLYDRLFHCGEYDMVFGQSTALSGQPSYASRLPSGSYVGTQLWLEVRSSSGGSNTVTVTYTNQSGVAGRSTSKAFSFSARYMFQFPLQAGDSGVQKIESVTTTFGGGGVGACNIVVMRPLWLGFLPPSSNVNTTGSGNSAYNEIETTLDDLCMLPVYDTSALTVAFARTAGSTTNPQIELLMEVAS